jgi:hypothetical protein
MPRGKLIYPMSAEIARLDTATMDANARYHDGWREPEKEDLSGDGIGEEQRDEFDTITIRGQIEHDREELQRMTRGGDIPDSAIGIVVHMRDMEKGDGTTSYVNADGTLIFRKNDRLVRILDRRGTVVNSFPDAPMFCTHVQRAQADIGRTSNLAILVFADRPKGLA